MITAWHHPGFSADIGKHIMPMRKFQIVADSVNAKICAPPPVTAELLGQVHHPAYIEAIRTGEPRELAESQKFPWSPHLWESVLLTNGAVVAAGRTALDAGVSAAIASGFHHSCYDHGEGFCTFNGLILAAEILRAEGRIKSAAILDMDLHYGNGTATLAASRPWVRQVSIYGNDYWENVCYHDVSTKHHADGETHRSTAIPAGADNAILQELMEQSIPWLLDDLRPDLLIYQAGADYLRDDPYSPLDLDHAALRERDRLVFQMAKSRGIPVAWTLAGGYAEDINKIVLVHTNTFLAAEEIYGRS